MEAISALWDSGVLGGMASMVVTILGQLSAMNTQKFTSVLETLQKQQTADLAVHDAAFKRSGDSASNAYWSIRNVGCLPVHFRVFQRHSSSRGDARTKRRLALGLNS